MVPGFAAWALGGGTPAVRAGAAPGTAGARWGSRAQAATAEQLCHRGRELFSCGGRIYPVFSWGAGGKNPR